MMGQPHKHAEILKAIADGVPIQINAQGKDSTWVDWMEGVSWSPLDNSHNCEYRIKPELPKYPQTKMADNELQQAANQMVTHKYGERWMLEARRVANAAIARAIEDKQVYLPLASGEVVLLSDANGKRIFMVDGEEHVPVSMLEKVALAIAEDCDLRMQYSTYQPITVDAIIASVKEGK